MLLKKKSLFSSLFKTESILNDDDDMYWDWTLGHDKETLPFRSIPITALDIWNKNWSLKNKIRKIYKVCVQPIFRRKITWQSGGSGNMHFHWFDWLTLRQGYKISYWLEDTYQKECWYEKSIFAKDFEIVRTKCCDHSQMNFDFMTEERWDEIAEELHELEEADWGEDSDYV